MFIQSHKNTHDYFDISGQLTDSQWWWINPDWSACLSVLKVDEGGQASVRPVLDSHFYPRYVLLLSSSTSIYNTALSLRLFSLLPMPSAHQIPLLNLSIPYFSFPCSLSLSLSFSNPVLSLPFSPRYLVWFIASCWKGWRFNNSAPPHQDTERENAREEEL